METKLKGVLRFCRATRRDCYFSISREGNENKTPLCRLPLFSLSFSLFSTSRLQKEVDGKEETEVGEGELKATASRKKVLLRENLLSKLHVSQNTLSHPAKRILE